MMDMLKWERREHQMSLCLALLLAIVAINWWHG
jgi:hypothetical protein